MESKLHEELDAIKGKVLDMGVLARQMLKESMISLSDLDVNVADDVLAKKDKIMEMDENIEHRCIQVISLYQPMAVDARAIAAYLKLTTYITRIGRYGKDIANVTKELADKPHNRKLVSLNQMAKIVDDMICTALKAFEEVKEIDADVLSEQDDDVDCIRYSIFRECLTYMMEDSKNITRCTHYVMVARYLERCADHACKMAEKINYIITGKRMEIR
ncbi:MAG: phosphate signaling complex protein PhoU [Candidatus Thermoplasmatota archaeon]|nr:phosphate signaling complex protein PhoU [Candidatus Thermoplasmatota archaeon]